MAVCKCNFILFEKILFKKVLFEKILKALLEKFRLQGYVYISSIRFFFSASIVS